MNFVIYFANGFIDAFIVLLLIFVAVPKLLNAKRPIISKKLNWFQIVGGIAPAAIISFALHYFAEVPFLSKTYLVPVGVIFTYFMFRVALK